MPGKWCDGTNNNQEFRESKAFCEGRASRAASTVVYPFALTGVAASNNGITWTGVGTGGGLQIRLVDPGANSQALAVTAVGLIVTVSLATGAGGAITSTATEVISAVGALPAAAALMAGANTGASTGAGVVVAEVAVLTGGSNPLQQGTDESAAWDRGVASKVAAEPDGCCAPTGAAAA